MIFAAWQINGLHFLMADTHFQHVRETIDVYTLAPAKTKAEIRKAES
jgi:hypothetical protein